MARVIQHTNLSLSSNLVPKEHNAYRCLDSTTNKLCPNMFNLLKMYFSLKNLLALLQKGFHQCLSIDFKEICNLFVKPTIIQLIISITISYVWSLRQLEVNNAFLQVIYKLHQAPRAWFHELHFFILINFQNSKSKNSFFIYRYQNRVIYLHVYVNDIIVTHSHPSTINQFINTLTRRFSLKDLASLNTS
ncbi:hypothetical protein VitviT2T_024681 [Vitis vinifera]|uniref:Reverse transcriptase Ty1/copia-type domain-containing protein n=1 Tax=Vitis vinifera TaxID=29760 RepID=A0ABY9DH52_VITVI|nr:hypothetical protein VitviT2T_024681 [Vitis vinifera]